jgi:NhaP-type Na+/H+ or K+/H+ antiporter
MTVIFPIQTRDQRAVLAVALTFSTLAVIAVSLRLLAHHIAHKPWTSSDYFLIAACVS